MSSLAAESLIPEPLREVLRCHLAAHREIIDAVAACAATCVDVGEPLLEQVKSTFVFEVEGYVMQTLDESIEDRLRQRVAGCVRYSLMEARNARRDFRSSRANNRESRGKVSVGCECIESGHEFAFGQIPVAPKITKYARLRSSALVQACGERVFSGCLVGEWSSSDMTRTCSHGCLERRSLSKGVARLSNRPEPSRGPKRIAQAQGVGFLEHCTGYGDRTSSSTHVAGNLPRGRRRNSDPVVITVVQAISGNGTMLPTVSAIPM